MRLPQFRYEKGMPPTPRPGEFIALDLEIFGADKNRLHRPEGEFAMLSIGYSDGAVYVITKEEDVQEALDIVYASGSSILVYHNAVFDIRQLNRWADHPRGGTVWDTMLMEQGLFGGYYTHFDLASLSARWLHLHMKKEVRETFSSSDELTQEQIEYGAKDAYITVLCALKQAEYMQKIGDPTTYDRYAQTDMPMI